MEQQIYDVLGKSYDMVLQWCVTYSCNLSCPQCIASSFPLKGKHAPETINIRALKEQLEKIDKTVKFIFTGGEPFYVRNILKAFSIIAKKNYIAVITNLTHPTIKKFAQRIDPSRVPFIMATAHMRQLKKYSLLERFLHNCAVLQKKGFTLLVRMIAYPYIIDDIQRYKELFKSHNIELGFKSFQGVWKNKTYPQAYTIEEIDRFSLDKIEFTNPGIFSRKNSLCNAGYNIGVIMNDGEVRPCYALYKKIGNIYEGINFRKSLIRCPVDICTCPFPVFEQYIFNKALAENQDK